MRAHADAGTICPASVCVCDTHVPGVSGAGRSAKESNLYVEIAEGINAYGVSSHRHMPEIEQGLSEAAGEKVTISFTPHLMPISR